MKFASISVSAIIDYLQEGKPLPSPQLRRLGLIYSGYRLIVSIFLMLMVYVTAKVNSSLELPTLLQQTALTFYVLLSLILLGLYFVVTNHPQRQLALGLALDVIILSLLLYTSGAPDLQLTMLYMVVVAASFMLLNSTQALVITLLAIIFVIYQQFFYAIANSIDLTNLGDALLMSASFLAVGFLSWSVSQRLVHVEKKSAQQAQEVDRLNNINQEVISQMVNGVIVIDKQYIVLANQAAYHLLGIDTEQHSQPEFNPHSSNTYNYNNVKSSNKNNANKPKKSSTSHTSNPLINFQRQLIRQHTSLIDVYLTIPIGQSRSFIYELPKAANTPIINKLRIQIIPLKDNSQMVLLEDLRREQANAQQLKLASLGQLTASIAHEIRNPLSAISQASQLLMEDIIDSPTPANNNHDIGSVSATATTIQPNIDTGDNHELYKMIFAQTKRVNRIIEDILKLSRQQQSDQQLIEIAIWMPQFLDNYFSAHDVALDISTSLIIDFDPRQLEQILINLINNGLRYSSLANSHAYVEVKIYSAKNDVIIDILDNGGGVNSSDIESLFNPFFTTDQAGTGLGLYLSQAFTEANHAQLMYVAEHEKTCFRLMIPNACSTVENE